MKIRGVMARKSDTPEYVRKMQQEIFDVLSKAKSRKGLQEIEQEAQEVREKYMLSLEDAE